jgi:hypothetical protein
MAGEGRTKGGAFVRGKIKTGGGGGEGRRKGDRKREGLGRKREKEGVNGKDQNEDSICSNVIFKGDESAARPLKRKEKEIPAGDETERKERMKLNAR